ncbi:MAG: NAD(P)H-dependent oxidoreductase [Planctomycetota bacterium]
MLIISSSLHPESRSRRLAHAAAEHVRELGLEPDLLDLRETDLPLCDGDSVYEDPRVGRVRDRVERAESIVFAGPIYNYGPNAAAKNLIELTGKAWTGKVVGLIAAAGGQSSYQSPMSMAGMLMLDFRCLIVPRFVYATEAAFNGDGSPGLDLSDRTIQLVAEVASLASAIAQADATA